MYNQKQHNQTAEQYQKKNLTFLNPDQQIANETFILILLNKATVMELERLNKKIDLLTKAINQLKKP
jgi:DNA uptake protein ComE-like DNA-binding protein